jgi:hypothetical protein
MSAPSAEQVERILQDLSLESLRAAFKAEEARLADIPPRPISKGRRAYFYNGGSYAMGPRDEILPKVNSLNDEAAVSARRRALERDGIFARVVCYDEPLFCHAFTCVEYDDKGRRVLKGD